MFDSVFHESPTSVGFSSSGIATAGIDVTTGQVYYQSPNSGGWQPIAGGESGAFLPLSGGTMTGVIEGDVSFTDADFGPITGGLSLTDTYGNTLNTGQSSGKDYIAFSTGTFNSLFSMNDSGEIDIYSASGASLTINSNGFLAISSVSGYSVQDSSGYILFQENGPRGITFNGGTGGNIFNGGMFGVNIFSPTGAPNSSSTAGTQGQLTAGTDGNLYFCTVTGTAGNATWIMLTGTPV